MFKKFLIVLLFTNVGLRATEAVLESQLDDATQENEDVEFRKRKCRTFNNVVVCNNLKTCSLTVTNNETVDGLTVTGNQTVGGSLTVAGPITASSIQTTDVNQTINGQLTITNPVIAIAAGGNLLDYAYFSTSNTTPQILISGAAVTFDNPAFNSAGITLAGNTITFVNTGIYLISAFITGISSTTEPVFEFSFSNPGGGNIFSGGTTSIGQVTTTSTTIIIQCSAGRTMSLINTAASGTFALSIGGGSPATIAASVAIVRLQ